MPEMHTLTEASQLNPLKSFSPFPSPASPSKISICTRVLSFHRSGQLHVTSAEPFDVGVKADAVRGQMLTTSADWSENQCEKVFISMTS